VDAAYGGYFLLAGNLDDDTWHAFDAVPQADSIAVDPHKHGLQPYGCGCILFRDPAVATVYRHDSPYTYFTADDLHLGMISLECSRPGAAAVALWTTLRMFPLKAGGAFAKDLQRCRQAALALHAHLSTDRRLVPLMRPELDVVVWAVQSPSATVSSDLARELFQHAARADLHLALADFSRPMVPGELADMEWDAQRLTCLRACVMKPEHLEWMPRILKRLDQATEQLA
jgi:glutamate/tyrosine decarboxylase-like PLP-dependent enzyme